MEGRIDLAYNQNFIKIIILWFFEHKVNDGFSGPKNDGINDTYQHIRKWKRRFSNLVCMRFIKHSTMSTLV